MSDLVNTVLGIALFVGGVAFIVLGFAAALREYDRTSRTKARGVGIGEISKLVDAVTALLAQLAKSPFWLSTTFVGFLLLGAGGYILADKPF